jgi:hypothetical protein
VAVGVAVAVAVLAGIVFSLVAWKPWVGADVDGAIV